MIGTTIGNYKILRELGTGGMGTVYLAENLSIGNKVAIKMLHPHLVKSENIKTRFLKEARTQAILDHPNITKVIDFVSNDQGLFIILEFVEGEPLNDFLFRSKGLLPEKEANHYMAKILDAVGYAHDKGIVHRDLKTANIMVTPNRGIKIMDFGIAKLANETMSLTKTGSRLGSPLYMSPEQVTNGQVDFRSDIYSLGVVYHEMLTGTPVYDQNNNTEFEIYNKIVKQPLPRLKDFYKMNSDRAQDIVDTATAKLPLGRFQSCKEFKGALLNGSATHSVEGAAIRDIPRKKPPQVKPVSTPKPYAEKDSSGDNSSIWVIAVLLALVLLGGGAYYFSQNKELGINTGQGNGETAAAEDAFSKGDYKKAYQLYSQLEPQNANLRQKLEQVKQASATFEKNEIAQILEPYLGSGSFLGYTPTDDATLEALLQTFKTIETDFMLLEGNDKIIGEGAYLPEERKAMSTLKSYFLAKKSYAENNYAAADSLLSDPNIINTEYISRLRNEIASKLGESGSVVPYDFAEVPPKLKQCNQKNTSQQKKCFEDQINRLVFEKIDTKAYGKLGVNGRQSVSYYFEVAPNGKLTNIKVRAPHPQLEAAIATALGGIGTVIPGQNNGVEARISFFGKLTGVFGETRPVDKEPDYEPARNPDREPEPEPSNTPIVLKNAYMADVAPIYPGCEGQSGVALATCTENKIITFIQNTVDTKALGRLGLPSGKQRVYISFNISENGDVRQINVRTPLIQVQEEVERVVRQLPAMVPGQVGGRNVTVNYGLTIFVNI